MNFKIKNKRPINQIVYNLLHYLAVCLNIKTKFYRMCFIKPFKGLRSKKEDPAKISLPSTDHLSVDIIKEYKNKNPWSYLNIFNPDCELSNEKEINIKAKERFNLMKEKLILENDTSVCFYVYKISTKDHSQTGIITTGQIIDYNNNNIQGHEKIYIENSEKRLEQIKNLNAQIGPIYVVYPNEEKIESILHKQTEKKPTHSFDSIDNCKHQLWVIDDKTQITNIEKAFNLVKKSYIADGHHRIAALSRFAEYKKSINKNHTGEEPYNFFMMSLFPDNKARILDYNRLLKDLNRLDVKSFIEKISEHFIVKKQKKPYSPKSLKSFGMYVDNSWFSINLKEKPKSELEKLINLDINILHKYLFEPILSIGDPRVDKRVDCIAGFHGLEAIEKEVKSGNAMAGFSLFPTPIEHVIKFANKNLTMPPKSTWFDPKPLDGLVTYEFKE